MTKTSNILKVSLSAIGRNKTRAILTMLGIIIGVACVIATIGIGEGAKLQMQSQLMALGTNFVMVFPGATTSSGARMGWGSDSRLNEADVEAIRNECDSCAYVSAQVRTTSQVIYGNQNWTTNVQGAEVDWPLIRSWNLEKGVFFTDSDNRGSAKVCVIGKTIQTQLFAGEDPLGKIIRISNLPFRIVGVLERKGGSFGGSDMDDLVVAPYETVRKRLMGRRASQVGIIMISAAATEMVGQVEKEVTDLLRQRHRIAPGQEDDFSLRSQTEMLDQAAMQSRTLSILLWSVAGVSLLVGGIGIMNIMLVSVTERTREIGIRMAIGAKGGDIRSQFLVEALVLSLSGGTLGIFLGGGIQKAVARFGDWPVLFQPEAVALAFLFSAVVGVFFGLYPAVKASRLDPIEALRYE
jgi:putative ABC transport system permease protein